MSTRCQVIVKDGDREQWFYRHSDGYPEGVKVTLDKFVSMLRSGQIRDNLEQANGWMVILGAIEYQSIGPDFFTIPDKEIGFGEYALKILNNADQAIDQFSPKRDWKVGAYEPCQARMHGDIEHLYVVDLEEKDWSEVEFDIETNKWHYGFSTSTK